MTRFIRLDLKRGNLWFLATTVTIPPTSATASIVIIMRAGTWCANDNAWTCDFGSFPFTKHFTGNRLNPGGSRLFWRRLYRYRRWRWTHRRGGKLDAAAFLQLRDFIFNGRNNLFVLFSVFKEIRNVEESVSVEADVHESRLHAGKDFRYFTFINIADDPLRAVPLDIKLNEFVVLENGELRFLGCCRND